jgi:hypothetical protein
MNLSGYILVCDYHIGEEEFKQALDAAEKSKEDADNKLSDEIEKAAKNKAEVDDWADSAFSSITKKRESLIQHNYSIYESYISLYRIKNEADNKQSSNNTQTKITTPNEDDFAIASNRFGQVGKTLKTAFLYGPSESVKSKGKIYVEIDGEADQDEVADDEKRLSDEIEKADKDSKKDKNNESTIYHDYSIYEAYSLLNTQYKNKVKNEADEDDDSSKSSTMADTDLFVSGATFIIKVILENEGYSEWKVFINSDVPSKQYSIIKNALKSGEFKKAYEIAGQYTDTDGLVPMSCKTYIYNKPACHIPWLGHCRYGFAAGSEDNDPEIANTLFLAVAPFNAAKGSKPDAKGSSDEVIVFKTAYNVTGDISDGKVGSLVNFVKNQVSRQADRLADERPDDYDDIDDELTKYLKDRFKCIGDSSMYKQFLQIREYLSVELKEKEPGATTSNLQIDLDESTNIKSYANQIKSKKALIFY